MFRSTLDHLKCPSRLGRCAGTLELKEKSVEFDASDDILQGEIICAKCKSRFPILAGVAIIVPDVESYLLEHVKGISRQVKDSHIPSKHRKAFSKARREIETEQLHIDDDLEAERVNALYVMTHYLKAQAIQVESPILKNIIHEYWDQGPISRIARELEGRTENTLVELGCGAGGLYAALAGRLKSYLGIDSSFASIAIARHLLLGAPFEGQLLFPGDLLEGPVSRKIKLPEALRRQGEADFIVCDVQHPPLKSAHWKMTAALNLIDMMENPEELPQLQQQLLETGGLAIQSCPYIWHPGVARKLRKDLPAKILDSARAVEWLYVQAGFAIERRELHIPWLFFKHLRQLEIYSVHLFFATKR